MLAVVLGVVCLGIAVGGASGATGDATTAIDTEVFLQDRPNTPQAEQPPDDEHVVVHYEDDHVLTAEIAGELPPRPYVTVNGSTDDGFLVVDEHEDTELDALQTEDGTKALVEVEIDGEVEKRPVVRTDRTVEEGTDLAIMGERGVIHDWIEFDHGDRRVETVDGGNPVEVDGNPIEYPWYDETNYVPEIVDVTDVDEGETLEVEVEVTHDRWVDHSEVLSLTIVGSERWNDRPYLADTTSLELSGNESETVTLQYETDWKDYHADMVVVDIDGNTDSQKIDIGASGAAVDIEGTNTPMAGDDLEVDVRIDRFGDYPSGSQVYPITLFVDGDEVETRNVELGPGSETTRTLTYETTDDDPDAVDVRVASKTDDDSATVPVVSHERFQEDVEVDIVETDVGDLEDEFLVTAEFEYTGNVTEGWTEFDAILGIDGNRSDNRTVRVPGSGTETVTFEHDRETGDPPAAYATVETPQVTAHHKFDSGAEVAFVEYTDPVPKGGEITADVGIENAGETPGLVTVSTAVDIPFAVESDAVLNESAPLNPGETFTQEVAFDLREEVPSPITLEATAEGGQDRVTIDVRENESILEIEEATIDGIVDEDEELTITASIVNAGGATESREVTFSFDGEPVGTETISPAPDEERTVSTTFPEPDEEGTFIYGVDTGDDTVSHTVATPGARADDGLLPSLSLVEQPWLLVVGLLVLLAAAGILVARRVDAIRLPDSVQVPEQLQPYVARVQAGLRAVKRNVRTLLGGEGTVVVENTLPKTVTVRVLVSSDGEVVFREDLTLEEGERREFTCLPSSSTVEVGSGVDDVAAHHEVFPQGTSKVGIVLQPQGIVIGEL
ncbi:hypothetical protein [Halopiger goleimassiliensis]|uniref:hypothetical protein n=1 Tax=Halopiger goleimassiliensis TaxID=1293048 RepID=UPI000677D7CD|nr:hypothetical protein [Halopiger goleimassiliensis]